MGRRSRHNQGNLGNYFQNLKDYFLGTNKANKASDDITREYQKQIDERTKKRNEERTQELSDFDTARSQAAEDIRKQNKAGYDAAVSTRQTALQDADADSATNAGHATNADYATKAANADHATNADHANVADKLAGGSAGSAGAAWADNDTSITVTVPDSGKLFVQFTGSAQNSGGNIDTLSVDVDGKEVTSISRYNYWRGLLKGLSPGNHRIHVVFSGGGSMDGFLFVQAVN